MHCNRTPHSVPCCFFGRWPCYGVGLPCQSTRPHQSNTKQSFLPCQSSKENPNKVPRAGVSRSPMVARLASRVVRDPDRTAAIAKHPQAKRRSLEAVAHQERTAGRHTWRRTCRARRGGGPRGRHPCRRAARPRTANTVATRLPCPPRRLCASAFRARRRTRSLFHLHGLVRLTRLLAVEARRARCCWRSTPS